MEQVRELLNLIKGMEINDGLVAASFMVRHVQPYKERAHPGKGVWGFLGRLITDGRHGFKAGERGGAAGRS